MLARTHQIVVQPNFTGVWTLIGGESDFGFLLPPSLRVDTIVHDNQRLLIRTQQKDSNGDLTIDRDLTIGGEPEDIMILGGARRVRAFWEETVLIVETRYEVSDKARRVEDRWTLEAGADWLTIQRRHEQPGGPVRQRLRLQRWQNQKG